jgi:hypothetical protein
MILTSWCKSKEGKRYKLKVKVSGAGAYLSYYIYTVRISEQCSYLFAWTLPRS